MGRAAQTISFALLVSSVRSPTTNTTHLLTFAQAYLLLALPLLTEDSPIPSILPTKIQVEIIPVLPIWALITLGAYLLGRLGLGVLRFNDAEAAYKELQGQLETARKSLDNRKIAWD
jgi:dolichol-phosphate mannosyltransferase subunit 3